MLQKLATTTNFNEHFTLANIPFGVISTSADPKPQIATRLYGDVFLISELLKHDLLNGLPETLQLALSQSNLNAFAALGRSAHQQVRIALQSILKSWPGHKPKELTECALPVEDVTMHLPVSVGDFSDFSCSRNHVLNAGEAVLGKRELPPGFLHFPIGYAGRSSSIVPSGKPVRRPLGQFRTPGGVSFGPSRAVDFELEIAAVVGKPSQHGHRVKIEDADEHLFGLVLLNDWSARDIQGLEMNPLGPFNGKSFGTTVSPWIITLDALESFSCLGVEKDNMVNLAPYLRDPKTTSHYAIKLQVDIDACKAPISTTVCKSQFEWLYWTLRDMIAHHTVNGCPLNAGDLIATGTISGEHEGSHGCLLESSKGGKSPVILQDGQTRVYLQDGDGVRLTGWAGELGSEACVGFGECYGLLEPTLDFAET